MGVLVKPASAALLINNRVTDGSASIIDSSESELFFHRAPVTSILNDKPFEIWAHRGEDPYIVLDFGEEGIRPGAIAFLGMPDPNTPFDPDQSTTYIVLQGSNVSDDFTGDSSTTYLIPPYSNELTISYLGPDKVAGTMNRVSGGGTPETTEFLGFLHISSSQSYLVFQEAGGSSEDFGTVLISNNGILDTSYGTDGEKDATVTGVFTCSYAVADTSGRLVAVGTGNGDARIGVITSAGDMDTNFSGDGLATKDWNGESGDRFSYVVEQSTGHYVAGGPAVFSTKDRFGLVRYSSTGTATHDVNTQFSGSLASSNDTLVSLAVGASDSIYAFGFTISSSPNRSGCVAKYSSTLVADTGFNVTGKREIVIDDSRTFFRCGQPLSDGKLLVFGSAGGVPVSMRLNSDGSTDTTYGTDGIKYLLPNTDDGSISRCFMETDGSILIAGVAYIDNILTAFVAKIDSNGNLDKSFGTAGVTRVGVGTFPEIKSFQKDSNGYYVLTGQLTGITGVTLGSGFIARLVANGAIDTTFSPSEPNDPRRYWRITFPTAAFDDDSGEQDFYLKYLFMGEYLDVRPDINMDVDFRDRSKTFVSYSQELHSDAMDLHRATNIRIQIADINEVIAVKKKLQHIGSHKSIILDAMPGTVNVDEREMLSFYGRLDEKSLDIELATANSYDITIRIQESRS